jgi:polysaccharide biosynthesis/export protein
LGPGDRIEVEILGEAASRTELTIGPDGKVYFHMLPGLDVSGLTLQAARLRLEKALGEYLRDPQVAVNLREVQSKHVWLMGRVGQPGLYPLTGPMTLVEALTLAGGTSQSASLETTEELADLRHSFVVRQGEMLPVDFERLLRQGDMAQNIYLRPDDFIFVPSSLSKEIFVLGAVRSPTAVPYRNNLTLVAAIASTGGLIPRVSHGAQVAIVRGSLSQPVVSVVDVAAILKGTAPDVVLEPRDIVYVPNSPYKTLNRYVDMILNTFVGTIAANEGIRAIDPSGVGVGINVPVGGK